jgi:oligopeptide/dipeptide ABC transporter ATP-binding protein
VLEVLKKAAASTSSAVILITHDLGVVAGLVSRVAVMYAGQIVEEGSVDALYYQSRMPYAWGLMESIARLDQRRLGRLRPIDGSPPNMRKPPSGCRFHPRCPYRDDDHCLNRQPELIELDLDHRVRCHYSLEPGWFSPAERLIEVESRWHPRVVARERAVDRIEAAAGGVA